MPFEHGPVSFRMLQLPRALPPDAVDRFADCAAPPLSASSEGEVRGWVTGRHLLDRDINPQTAYFGGHLRLTLLTAERKIPSALLQAECRMEELAVQAAKDAPFLSRRERAEIKRSVEDRLRPQMPPQLSGIPIVHSEAANVVYAAAPSLRQLDALSAFWLHTLGFNTVPCDPETLAEQVTGRNAAQWAPASFSPDLRDEQIEGGPGREFLTWLWMLAEQRGGLVSDPAHGEVAVTIEGPLRLVGEGKGAHETVLRHGQPLLSAETTTALRGGKLLRSARCLLGRGDDVYAATVDADEFVFRALALPEREAADPITRFQDRIRDLDDFRELFLVLYRAFLRERTDAAAWHAAQADIHRWVRERKTHA